MTIGYCFRKWTDALWETMPPALPKDLLLFLGRWLLDFLSPDMPWLSSCLCALVRPVFQPGGGAERFSFCGLLQSCPFCKAPFGLLWRLVLSSPGEIASFTVVLQNLISSVSITFAPILQSEFAWLSSARILSPARAGCSVLFHLASPLPGTRQYAWYIFAFIQWQWFGMSARCLVWARC